VLSAVCVPRLRRTSDTGCKSVDQARNRSGSCDVPIHIISNRPELLAPFQRRGFVDGLMPRQGDGEKSFAMNRFLPRLLFDFITK
jgi:hypothetical protein